MSNRLNQDREKELQPKRMEYAKEQLQKLELRIMFESTTEIRFEFKGKIIHFFPYSGWHSGEGIKDGRSIEKI